MNANEKIVEFVKTAIKYYGKEISLESNQFFEIAQIIDIDGDGKENKYNYIIQYGFPQSGCIRADLTYSEEKKAIDIDSFSVHALPKGKTMVMPDTNYQVDAEDISIRMNFGLDIGTQEHKSLREIEENPNALKMLDDAIFDLSNALVRGECSINVPIGSERIPCCNTVPYSNTKDRLM